jgi:ABC-2 type transport system ATP-binding protein
VNVHADLEPEAMMARWHDTAARGELAVEVRGLSKSFGSRRAVDELTFGIPNGVIAGLVGPNGAGKTTTMRMLVGLVRPTGGSAAVLGTDIARSRAFLSRVGSLIESPVFYPGLSGRGNLRILARLRGVAGERVGRLLHLVDLDDHADEPVRKYSLGMKQRLGLAMALLSDPDLLILDEPANGLDPAGIIQIRDLMRGLRGQGKTILVSSHLLGELEQVADWLVILDRGRAIFNGPAGELREGLGQLQVVTERPEQLDAVASIATAAGYQVTSGADHVRIACPQSFAGELTRRASATGVTVVEIRRVHSSLEESFLALLEGDR